MCFIGPQELETFQATLKHRPMFFRLPPAHGKMIRLVLQRPPDIEKPK
jgi:hypothetical protein